MNALDLRLSASTAPRSRAAAVDRLGKTMWHLRRELEHLASDKAAKLDQLTALERDVQQIVHDYEAFLIANRLMEALEEYDTAISRNASNISVLRERIGR